MSEPQPTFTLEHEEQTWLVRLAQGSDAKMYSVSLMLEGNGKMSVWPFALARDTGIFTFKHSDPNMVLAIGRLLIACARKCGATDA